MLVISWTLSGLCVLFVMLMQVVTIIPTVRTTLEREGPTLVAGALALVFFGIGCRFAHKPIALGRPAIAVGLGLLAVLVPLSCETLPPGVAEVRTIGRVQTGDGEQLHFYLDRDYEPGRRAAVASLSRLPGLATLTLGRPAFGDAELAVLGACGAVQCDLHQSGVTDAGLAHLRGLTRLRHLDLSATRVTDAGLAHLAGLPLEELDLSRTAAAGPGLANLASLAQLKRLRLLQTGFTVKAAPWLARLTQIRELTLGENPLADDALPHLAALENLEGLHLWSTLVTDRGLAHLAKLRRLRSLSIGLPGITDAGLAHLAGLTELEVIDLNKSAVKGPGLAHLKRLTKLSRLWLRGRIIPDADRAALLAVIPGLEIIDDR